MALSIFATPNWPPRCPKCAEQLVLTSALGEDGNPTLTGYHCRPCDLDFTSKTLKEWSS